MKVFAFIILLALGFAFNTPTSQAHSGRTDKRGCHTCKTKCPKWGLQWGEYHCHNRK